MPLPDLDALGLVAAQRRTTVAFGPVDASAAFAGAKISAAISQQPDAELKLELERSAVIPDYFGGLTVAIEEGGLKYPRFAGSVVSAEPDVDGIKVNALGAASLSEGMIAGFASRGIPVFELFYTLARAGGMRDEQLNIEGLDTLPRETFEVVTPIDGISAEHSTSFAGIRIIPPQVAERLVADLEVNPSLRSDYQAPAYALTFATATRALSAEEDGLAEIDFALAWLTTHLRYGFATLPDGGPVSFTRKDSLTRVTRREVVAVRGIQTRRKWLRRPGITPGPGSIALCPDGARFDNEAPRLTLQERLAFITLARAVHEPDPLASVRALFEAIEFYTHGVTVRSLFTDGELKQVKRSATSGMNTAQKQRLQQVVGMLNDAPLRRKLTEALDQDGVPITREESDLLWRLRETRNAVVHGKSSELPKTEDVEYATSLVARMLVFRAARRRNTSNEQDNVSVSDTI